MKNRNAVAIAALVLVTPGLFAAEKERLSFRQAIEEGIQQNPLLRTGANRIESAIGQTQQARLKPNPRLVVQQENARAWQFDRTPSGGMPGFVFFRDTDTFIYGGQVIERGGKRERRMQFAQAELDRIRSERGVVEQKIQNRIAAAYWAAVTAAKLHDLYQQNLANFDQIVRDQRNRVQEGAAAGADLLRIEVERDRLSALAQNAELEAVRTRIGLLSEMGRSDFHDIELADSLDSSSKVSFKPIDQVFSQRKEIQTAKAAILQTEANTRLQRANGKVDPELQLGYKRTMGFDTVYAGLNVPLPFRNKNQGNIASAAAEIRVAQSSLVTVEQQIRAELELAQQEYRKKQSVLRNTLKPLVEKSERSEQIIYKAFREGGFDLLRYLDASRARIEAQTMYYRGLGELHQSAVVLQQAQGDRQ